jgi:hypothetical protein
MRPVASSGACGACPDNRGRPRTATDRLVKRISFDEQHAEHIYEWLRMCWRGAPRRSAADRMRAHWPAARAPDRPGRRRTSRNRGYGYLTRTVRPAFPDAPQACARQADPSRHQRCSSPGADLVEFERPQMWRDVVLPFGLQEIGNSRGEPAEKAGQNRRVSTILSQMLTVA